MKGPNTSIQHLKDAKLKIAYFMPIFNFYSYCVKFPFCTIFDITFELFKSYYALVKILGNG